LNRRYYEFIIGQPDQKQDGWGQRFNSKPSVSRR